MQDESTPVAYPLVPRNGVLVLTGYGIRVGVERGHLTVSDGMGRARRTGRFSRIARDVKRLVIIGHTGTVSLDALHWLHDIGAAFVQLDEDGRIIVASCPASRDDARLRRAQALASTNGVGITIARDLLRDKLAGQMGALATIPDTRDAIAHIAQAGEQLETAHTPERLVLVEADAAQAYWQAWKPVPMRFNRKDCARVPEHWQTFGARKSPLSNSARNAVTPANALLNYLYAMLETEARLAAITLGLDPAMGILHADQHGRDSLACDLMEVVRPAVDAFVFTMLHTHTFRAADFFETRQGVCRVLPALAKQLAETAPRWAKVMAPIAEHVAQALIADRSKSNVKRVRRVPTLLTQANRSAGREAQRRQPKREPGENRGPKVAKTCKGCGASLPRSERDFCDACLAERREEQKTEISLIGTQTLARRRVEGRDTSHGGEAGRKRSETHIQRMQEVRDWEETHGAEHDPEQFTREILPKLQGVPLRKIMDITGLSLRYCSLIRRGEKVPHPRHWAVLCGYQINQMLARDA